MPTETTAAVDQHVSCYHCGQPCEQEVLKADEKSFCCYGCKTVYEILAENNLCEYYNYQQTPGVNQRFVSEESFAYLDEPALQKKLLLFNSPDYAAVSFFVPNVHCISCIWLLENLQRLNKGIVKSEVNFAQKTVKIDFNPAVISLGAVARQLAAIGYAPQVNLEGKKESGTNTKSLVLKLSIAGFCFGNTMLFSFPEYLGLSESESTLRLVFSYLNILLAIPVTFYSAQDYFVNAWKSFQQRQINIDVPIAVGLAALFLRSLYDIISATGPGYLDSLTGLVFFLLVGRWFQSKTYESLAFDRDYKSYFPLAANRWHEGVWRPTVVYELSPGDRIQIRNMEIIPADSILLSAEAFIDYSFVTGEAKPVRTEAGQLLYAGGRLVGKPVEMAIEKATSQSYLTSLWNHQAFTKPEESRYKKIIDRAAQRFTWIVMGIAILTGVYWQMVAPEKMWLVVTAVLMVACPCALALAAPFTYGNVLRVFGRLGLYLKNADVIERLASINAVVFDKTGTVTQGAADVTFVGQLSGTETATVKALAAASSHPLSTLIFKSIRQQADGTVEHFREIPGKGLEGEVNGTAIRLGSSYFIQGAGSDGQEGSRVWVEVDGNVKGYFQMSTRFRAGVGTLIQQLGGRVRALLSGDQSSERERMKAVFPTFVELRFEQSPHEKMEYISQQQFKGDKVLMLGDGLNDSGALKQADVGLAVTDDTGVFTPACDGILEGGRLQHLDAFLQLSKKATTILKIAFGISFFYNIIALSFAVSGHLTPLVAAILMPISSISVVGFSTLAVNAAASRINKKMTVA
jgi:Cu+-exporting ATPase